MRWLVYSWRKYSLAARIAVRNRWQYPAEQIGPVLTYSLFVFIQSRIWAVAFAGGTGSSGGSATNGDSLIAGYDQFACTWYFVVAELCLMSGSGAFGLLSRDIKDGQVAYTLGRPYGFVLYNYAQRLGLGLNQALVFLVPGFLLASLSVGPLWPSGPGQVLAVLAALVLSISILFCLHAAIAMIAFWFEENSAFIWIFSKISLVAGTLIPLEFLPESWQAVLWWTPFPWISWAPARLAVAASMGPGGSAGAGGVVGLGSTAGPGTAVLLGGQLIWLVASAAIASAVFRLAVRRTTVQGG